MKSLSFVALVAVAASPVMAQDDFQVNPTRYQCDRGVEVPATYINAGTGSAAVIHVEGTQISLISEPAASGARYGWPSDGSHYVWWTKGPEATLYWHDGETGQEAVLLTCKQQG